MSGGEKRERGWFSFGREGVFSREEEAGGEVVLLIQRRV